MHAGSAAGCGKQLARRRIARCARSADERAARRRALIAAPRTLSLPAIARARVFVILIDFAVCRAVNELWARPLCMLVPLKIVIRMEPSAMLPFYFLCL